MTQLDELFSEYMRMRQNGLGVQEALRTLRSFVEPLNRDLKEELAQKLRAWENRDRTEQTQPIPGPPPSTEKPVSPILKKLRERQTTDDMPAMEHFIWVQCQHCGAKNREADVFCYSCGQMIDDYANAFDTKLFNTATSELYNNEFFSNDSILVLQARDMPGHFEIRPQMRNREVVIGRITENDSMRPDIDLSSLDAAELGVSRLHVAVLYDDGGNMVQIYDLGSSNGSYINGQKMHPSERRVLRHGDELRLGRLVMNVIYYHPGEQI